MPARPADPGTVPDTDDEPGVDAQGYHRAIAEVVSQAARLGIIPREARIGGSRLAVRDLTDLGNAMVLVHMLARTDRDLARWLAVEALSPEINGCVTELRVMRRVDEVLARREARLEALRRRTRPVSSPLADLADTPDVRAVSPG